MTAGNNGTGNATPEGDDPFHYLYRSEGGEGGQTEGGQAGVRQPGVPRTSYNQVRPVGSRTYGGQQGATGAQRQPNPHYAAPETLPGGAPSASHGGHGAHGGHGGHGASPARPNRRGLLIAAIAVVLVVAGGIGVAMMNNSSGKDDDKQTVADGGGSKGDSSDESDTSSKKKEKDKKDEPTKNPSVNDQQKRDAASLRLVGGATTETAVSGAQAKGGAYVTGVNQQGAGVEWTVEVKAAGRYRLNLSYGVPGQDANLTITANGKRESRPIDMRDHIHTKPGEWSSNWMSTWSEISLNKGTNTIRLSCEAGNKCDSHLDQLWIS
ncbi:carbohydrate-binding protein [Streptomyces sp. SCA3-4]|uniref:CBM35 domain-containing protein n=1 Tax=Streptomyces sichuanensis TaxID=2871810 RepID=UPI001CE2A69D|nr:carbohydrate-binding protein [Streptomyces sichuanensis]MCA6093418.1 carbohydrate-binding protein [Streptomyces sichuanensis]